MVGSAIGPTAVWPPTGVTIGCAASLAGGPDVIPAATELRQLGFEPAEEYTGIVWVGDCGPDGHRRFVPDTRASGLESSPTSGRLWMLQSPWPSWTLRETLNAMWGWLERPGATTDADADEVMIGIADFPRRDETGAAKWRRSPEQLEE